MKKEATICDICKKRLALEKCEICGSDLCMNVTCGRRVHILLGSNTIAGTFFRCVGCSHLMKKIDYRSEPLIDKDLRDKIVKGIARRIVADNLDEGTKR